MSRYLLLIFSVLICSLSAPAQSRTPELKLTPKYNTAPADTFGFEERPYFLLIDQSEKALSEQKYEEAALRLIEAMSVEPKNPLNVALMSNLGMIYYYNEQDSLALATLDEAVRRSPKLIGAHEHRARVLLGMGRDDEAYDEYTTIIEIDSLNTDARYYHGMMALYGGKLDVAKQDFALMSRVVPLSRRTILANSTLYAMTGQNLEAISGFRKLIEIEKMPEYYAQLAGCLIEMDNLNEASKVLGDGIALFPNDAELYFYRAKLNHLRYQPEEAHSDARRAIELGADPAHVAAIFKSKKNQ